jgi:ribonuclease HI
MMAIISWNCHGFRQHISDIRDLVNLYNPACIALQETLLHENVDAKLRHFSCLRKDYSNGERASGGVALLTSHDYPTHPLTLYTDLQAVAVQIHIHSLVTICNIYLPPNKKVTQNSLNNLINQLPSPFIIVGDFNGHSSLWGSSNTNPRRNQIEQLLIDHDLCILNTNEITYLHQPTRTYHSLDLAITSPHIFQFWTLSVAKYLYNSDHFPLILNNYADTASNQHADRFILETADWVNFRNLASITPDMVEENTIDEAVRLITSKIIFAANATIRKTSGRPRKQRKPWWNQDCKEAYSNKRKAFNRFRRYPTTENFIDYKKCKSIFRRTLRRSQRDSWRHYVNSISTSISSKQLWDKVKRSSGLYPNNQIHILNHNNQTISSIKSIADTLASSFANISSAANYTPSFKRIKIKSEKKPINFYSNSHFPYNSNFTLVELNRALHSTHKSSSGPDNISYPMLKNLSPSSINNILLLYNRIWQEHSFPSCWKMATVIPILKPGKPPSDPLSYRPIALTNCLCKILEKMINTRLIYFLEKNNCLSPWQSGFRRGRSTVDNIVDLETKIRNAFVRRNHLVSIFFDIDKAYDRTWRYGILRKLYHLDLRGNLPIFIRNFLSIRNFRVRIGNILSDIFTQEEGVPQGSVLSVTLFIVAIDDILINIPPSIKGNLYVDDLHISCEGNDIRFINRQLQTAVNRITNWTNENGFSLSSSKTSCVHFCRKRGIHPDPEIQLSGSVINVVKEFKFLGVIFDSRLTFIPHVLHLRKKCQNSLNILRVLSNTNWGADRSSLIKIYYALIRSKLDYGCVVYGSARKSVLQRLNIIHHSALRLCSGAFRTSPVESLYVDCHEAPLNLRRNILSLHYFFRISAHANHPLKNLSISPCLTRLYNARPSCILPFYQRIKQTLVEFNFDKPDIMVAYSHIPPWCIHNFKFLNPFKHFDKATTADIVYQQIFKDHRQSYNSYTPIFTDGSKSTNFVGSAFIIEDYTYSYKLNQILSVFTAELTAIFKALECVEQHSKRCFIIYTDSLSALQSLTSTDHTSHPLVFQILSLLDKLSSLGFSILFCWVPSHVGIKGNERADKAAKSAKNTIGLPSPYCDVKKHANHLMELKWQQYWDTMTTNKLHSVKPTIKHWAPLPSRKHDVILTRLRIGHTRFTHVHLLLGNPAPVCEQCKHIMTVTHIMIDCPKFKSHRLCHFGSGAISLKDLLSETQHKNLFLFLNDIGFYNYI